MVEEGEPDPEFESILDTVDPNRSVTCLINELFRGVKCQQYGCVVFRILLCLLSNYEECVVAGMATYRCRSTWHS